MRRLEMMGLCLVAALALTAVVAASASAALPAWYVCAKASPKDTGAYANKTCSEVAAGHKGGYELKEGVGKGKAFKGKGGVAALHVKTWLGDDKVECTSSTDSGTPVAPKGEKDVTVIYKGCKALGSKLCNSPGAASGEIKIAGLKGELGYVEESPVVAGLKLESEAHPGPTGELTSFECEKEIEATLTGGVIGVQLKDVNSINKESELVYLAGEYIGEHVFDGFKYVPLVNIVGWADEKAAFEQELKEDLAGEIEKLERPILKAGLCGSLIEKFLGVHCAPEAYSGLDTTVVNKGETLEVKA